MGKNIRVFVYLTVSFDVLGPWVFQKYGIILSFKDIVGMVTNDQPNDQPGEPRASLLMEH